MTIPSEGAFETIHLPHLEQFPLLVVLFQDVTNADFLREQLLQGNSDFEYAFLDASAVLCRDHLFAACFKAVNEMAHDRLRTRNVHSEIVFALSPNNNIAESFKRFGISSTSKHIIAVKATTTTTKLSPSEISTHLNHSIQGTATRLTDATLLETRDLPRLSKIFKFDIKGKTPNDAAEESRMLSIVLGTMALKGS